ncbi:hypothetical protein [Acetobacterium bakii]|uniref:Bacterial Ig-like domain-containing protein n=1 Tax=Acetobacterium bakii TaxID=52689 RepID=A0A0L6U0E2_9FIRM|nr:hypothetical protein [Acetobacterium bakii]KNZ41290.1 hypothetical protein AKG39_13355 [Acetobacterium bakii]
MKKRTKGGPLWKIVVFGLLTMLLFPTGLLAQDGQLATSVSIAATPPTVEFNSSSTELDRMVYKALSIVVVDGNGNKIDFTPNDITLDYTHQVGIQKITVTYEGSDQYLGSAATGTITITDTAKKEARLVLKANPPSVGYSADIPTLDKSVYDDLAISVVDENANKITFAPSDIALAYNHAVGSQTVAVTYKGNDQYNTTLANAKVEITGKQDTKISLAATPPPVAYTSDSAKLDLAVYQALSIVVVDAGNNKINFTASDIELSYNRAVGKQDVTVKYKGNDQYSPSTATGHVEITGKVDPPAPTKENTTITLAKSPAPVEYNPDPGKLDTLVYNALQIQVVDSKNNKITFVTTDIELSYNRVAGDQPVTVKFKGNDKYNPSEATQTIKITQKEDCSLVINANPPTVEYNVNEKALDDAVYKDLAITIVNENNTVIKFTPDDITLDYQKEVGEQEVVVKYKGNDNYKSAVATTRIVIVAPTQSNSLGIPAIIGIVLAVAAVAGVIGFVIYRKKHRG